MGRLAIFIDGGYVDSLARNEFGGVRLDYAKLSADVTAAIDGRTAEPVDLLRTLYYHCLPYQSMKPTDERRPATVAPRSSTAGSAGNPATR